MHETPFLGSVREANAERGQASASVADTASSQVLQSGTAVNPSLTFRRSDFSDRPGFSLDGGRP